MDRNYEITSSDKAGITTAEKYKVTRGRTLFLRINGEHPAFRMMTATASEDSGDFPVCNEKVRLLSAALKFGAELKAEPSFSRDKAGRDFIEICTINVKLGGTAEEDKATLFRAFDRFFEIYDATEASKPESLNEMREIYECLATDQSGEDVYLSDGVWLSSNGSMRDRGR